MPTTQALAPEMRTPMTGVTTGGSPVGMRTGSGFRTGAPKRAR